MWHSIKTTEHIKINELYSLFIAHYSNDYVFSGEIHNFWECVYVIEGSICVSADDRVYNMKKNQMVFHKPQELHKFSIESEKGAKLLTFSFNAEGEMSFFKDKVFIFNATQIEIIERFMNFLKKNNSDVVFDTKAYLHMYLEKSNTTPMYSQAVVSYIYQLFYSLLDNNTVSYIVENPEAKIFSEAVNYMNDNLFTSPNITDIAKVCKISATGLKRIFSKYSGLGVHKYLLMLKINASTQMLKDGLAVTEIAERLGFSSQGYFSLAFKRETGLSPTEYKHKYLV